MNVDHIVNRLVCVVFAVCGGLAMVRSAVGKESFLRGLGSRNVGARDSVRVGWAGQARRYRLAVWLGRPALFLLGVAGCFWNVQVPCYLNVA